MFEDNPSMFSKLQAVSIKMHESLGKLDDFLIVSDAISPLKVITLKKDANVEKTDKIYDFVRILSYLVILEIY